MSRGLVPLSLLLAGLAWAGEPEMRSITVPAELAAVTTNPEPSGIAWSAGLRRYLLVTDDSGLREEGSQHEPILLALGQDGRLDKAPIPIAGVKKINDPESICPGPNGTFFLVTSHSPNREERTTAWRRQLLQIKPDKGGMRVLASLDLTNIRGGGSLLALVGLPADGRLDIEAVTYRDDALYIGFKSPLTMQGEAVVARLSKPLAALRAHQIDARELQRFLAVPLCVDQEGSRICQGVSDMTFLPDGSLVLTANAPKGGPKDHGGALWLMPKPVGKLAPVMLRRFPGLKPEGVTLSADGRSLLVVFDTGSKVPQWTELPLPANH